MYWIYHLPHLYRYITNYAYKSMINKRWITLPVVYIRPFASKVVFERFEEVWVRRWLFLIIEGQGRNPCFERAPAPERFFPRKSHCSAFKLRSKKVERFMLLTSDLLIENPSKRSRANPRRKLKSHSFWTVKMHSKIRMCQPETVPLTGSFCLDVVDQMVK